MAELEEKRASRRVPLVTKIEAQAGGFPILALAENISVGGMLIHTADPVPEGQVVHLRFTLPGAGREIVVTAKVQRVTPQTYMGVHFENLDPADSDAIRQFVERS